MTSRRSILGFAVLGFVGSFCLGRGLAAEPSDPSGTWTWIRELEGQEAQSVLTLTYKDGELTGFYKRQGQVVPISNAKLDKDKISFDADGEWAGQKVHGKFKGKLAHDAINGSIEIVVEDGSLPLPWTAKRGVDFSEIAGIWKLRFVALDGNALDPTLTLAVDGGLLKGTYRSRRQGEMQAHDLKLDGSQLSWAVENVRAGQTFKAVYKGNLEAGAQKGLIKGSVSVEMDGNVTTLAFTGQRAQPGTEGSRKDATKKGAEGKSTQNAPEKQRENRHVIVMLKNRSEVLVVYAEAGKGPTFSILAKDGKEIAKQISLQDLQANYPQIYQQYRTSFVNIWADKPTRSTGRSAPLKEYRGVDFH